MEVGTGARPYRMGVRAQRAAATGERILGAAAEVFWESPSDQLSLEVVAQRAGVSVRTVIRRFGGREGLIAAATQREMRQVRAQRDQAPVGDVEAAVSVLLDHYEQLGDRVLKMLAAQDHEPGVRVIADLGRDEHLGWCQRVFAPFLSGRTGVIRQRRLAQFAAVCDVYVWKLLRRDAGLSRRQTELALVELLTPMTED